MVRCISRSMVPKNLCKEKAGSVDISGSNAGERLPDSKAALPACSCGAVPWGRTLMGELICEVCAHNLSHRLPLSPGEIPCPVVNGIGRVLPYGVYPNIEDTARH
jgi:hypothetical protein